MNYFNPSRVDIVPRCWVSAILNKTQYLNSQRSRRKMRGANLNQLVSQWFSPFWLIVLSSFESKKETFVMSEVYILISFLYWHDRAIVGMHSYQFYFWHAVSYCDLNIVTWDMVATSDMFMWQQDKNWDTQRAIIELDKIRRSTEPV